jgi:hypothetical protein
MKTIPWPFRALFWYTGHPLAGYIIVFLFGICWAYMPRSPEAAMLWAFLLPWVSIGVILLNLPLLGGAIRKFSLPLSTRQNHALEHGTIRLMEYGASKGLSGKALKDGFRVSGASSDADIRRAFSNFIALSHAEKMAAAISNHCGSMLAVAEGLGIALLFATIGAIVLWHPGKVLVALILGVQFVLFLVLRRPLGRIIQAKRLLSLDFERAGIQDIRKVPPQPTEKPPVYFVQTRIS